MTVLYFYPVDCRKAAASSRGRAFIQSGRRFLGGGSNGGSSSSGFVSEPAITPRNPYFKLLRLYFEAYLPRPKGQQRVTGGGAGAGPSGGGASAAAAAAGAFGAVLGGSMSALAGANTAYAGEAAGKGVCFRLVYADVHGNVARAAGDAASRRHLVLQRTQARLVTMQLMLRTLFLLCCL